MGSDAVCELTKKEQYCDIYYQMCTNCTMVPAFSLFNIHLTRLQDEAMPIPP